MHVEAYEGFGLMLDKAGVDRRRKWDVIDFGGQNVNGTVHDLLPKARITTLDIENADIIADARTWVPDHEYDMVICTEVFEHVIGWESIIMTAWRALKFDGLFVFTCASDSRRPHGATGALDPAPGEFYANVSPDQLRNALFNLFRDQEVVYQYPPGDAYGWARK